jgi:pilus assembly protein TadC
MTHRNVIAIGTGVLALFLALGVLAVLGFINLYVFVALAVALPVVIAGIDTIVRTTARARRNRHTAVSAGRH